MTRTYALKRLLVHGPMTSGEILDVMGGDRRTADFALRSMVEFGVLMRCGSWYYGGRKWAAYCLADKNEAYRLHV